MKKSLFHSTNNSINLPPGNNQNDGRENPAIEVAGANSQQSIRSELIPTNLDYSKWKEGFLRTLLTISGILTLTGILSAWSPINLAVNMIYLIIAVSMIVLAFVRVPYWIRAWFLLIALFSAATVQLLRWGPSGEATLIYTILIILATVIFDWIEDYIVIVITSITILAVAFATINGSHLLSGWILLPNSLYEQLAVSWSGWISYLIDLLILDSIVVAAIRLLKREFKTVLRTATFAMSELTANQKQLEQRVKERTRYLELAAEVGRSITQVRELDSMLIDAAEIIRTQFNLYYVQVYLLDPSQTNLILQSGTGIVGAELVGRSHRLPLDTRSINGRAATEKRPIVIPETNSSAIFKPNPLLPDTRSESAVPLLLGDRVVGVLDLQSDKAGILNEDVLPAFEALAGQFAIAIQNATLLAETEKARAEVEAQARRLTRANWVDYLDAIHKPEKSGFMFSQNQVTPLDPGEPIKENALVESISVTGESLGNLVVEMDGESPIARTNELVNAVARQVAQQIESLRLLESAERYRLEAEEASRRLTREGWQKYLEVNADESALGYIYDLNEVRPSADGRPINESSLQIPLKVREETIGKLAIEGIDSGDSESLALVNAVADRLSLHIENLRQFDQTQRGQVELDKRARQLATVAEISTAAATLLNPEELLQSVVDTAKDKFGLYHAHVYLRDSETNALRLAKGAGEVGRKMMAEKWQIEHDHPTSMVARAARTAEAVIANDIVHDMNSPFLSNTLLPNTRSEMAVPLIVGKTILGVFDVQADKPNRFTGEDVSIFTSLASQVAVALQNARAFLQAQRQAERETTLNVINQKIQNATTVEAVLQIAARELGHALGAPMTMAQLTLKNQSSS